MLALKLAVISDQHTTTAQHQLVRLPLPARYLHSKPLDCCARPSLRNSGTTEQAGPSDAPIADAQMAHARGCGLTRPHSGFVCESEEVSDAPSVVCFSADWFVPSDDRFGIGPKGIKTPLPPSHGLGVVPGGTSFTFTYRARLSSYGRRNDYRS
jgi:hypothetical protein